MKMFSFFDYGSVTAHWLAGGGINPRLRGLEGSHFWLPLGRHTVYTRGSIIESD